MRQRKENLTVIDASAAASDAAENEKALEALLFDDDGIGEIEARLGGFNIFEAIGLTRREELHSNFLAFLLDPNKSHGLGTDFLSRFIVDVVSNIHPNLRRKSLSEIALADFRRTRVLRETRGN